MMPVDRSGGKPRIPLRTDPGVSYWGSTDRDPLGDPLVAADALTTMVCTGPRSNGNSIRRKTARVAVVMVGG